MIYSAPKLSVLGTLAEHTLVGSTNFTGVCKSTVTNTDTGYLSFLKPGTDPKNC